MSNALQSCRDGSADAVATLVSPGDQQTVGRLRQDQQERLARLVDDHLNLAVRMVRHVGAPDHLAEDLVQEAFQICMNRIDDIQPGKERAFLIQTGMRLAANARRVCSRGREVSIDRFPNIVDAGLSPEEASDRKRAAATLEVVLGGMNLNERAVFMLYEVEEMTMTAIATLLDLPAGTVASRLRRAREYFTSSLKELGLGRVLEEQ
jgi:RNA polymerase sigma-70 factor (ECF subfamily)